MSINQDLPEAENRYDEPKTKINFISLVSDNILGKAMCLPVWLSR